MSDLPALTKPERRVMAGLLLLDESLFFAFRPLPTNQMYFFAIKENL
jgi:hypothetical protein